MKQSVDWQFMDQYQNITANKDEYLNPGGVIFVFLSHDENHILTKLFTN